MDDVYYTITNDARCEIKIKKSRFLGESFLIHSLAAANDQLEAVRKREHAASHHCFAWIAGVGAKAQSKYSDDGEPNGTAGRPIYDAMMGRELTNGLVVVTRYYGGVKLGTGGLMRAYAEAAQTVLDTSGRQQHFLTSNIKVTIELGLYDQLVRLTGRLGVRQESVEFSDRVCLTIVARRSLVQRTIDEITQLSAGKAQIEILKR
ncbi:MAG: YigZ family protein [bacterium]